MKQHPKSILKRTKGFAGLRLRVAFIGGLVLAACTTSGYAIVVHDPAQHFENVRQVLALLDQIDRATQQIINQFQMLRRLPVSVGRSFGFTAERLQRKLTPILPDAASNLGVLSRRTQELFPLEFLGSEVAWIDSRQVAWNEGDRNLLVRQRELQNQYVENADVTALRVEQLIEASNGEGLTGRDAPGQTAVLQAKNELLALLSHETDSVLALRAARLKILHDRYLKEQAEAAYSAAVHEHLTATWPR